MFVYKHDNGAKNRWVKVDNDDLDATLNLIPNALAEEATMFNRLEWVSYDPRSGDVFITETGRDHPASRWIDESQAGGLHAPHHMIRAAAQGTHPDSSAYADYYGRVLRLDMENNHVTSYLEAGPSSMLTYQLLLILTFTCRTLTDFLSYIPMAARSWLFRKI